MTKQILPIIKSIKQIIVFTKILILSSKKFLNDYHRIYAVFELYPSPHTMSMDKITQNFTLTLRRLRSDKKLTQEELAHRSGLDYKYLQKLEGHNPSSPTLSTLSKLANGLGISLVELIGSIPAEP